MDGKTPDRSSDLLVGRLLASLIAATVCGLGLMKVLTGEHVGRTRGGKEVRLDGGAAVAVGVCCVFLGLAPLALWFRGRRAALVWASACFILAAAALLVSLDWGGSKPRPEPQRVRDGGAAPG